MVDLRPIVDLLPWPGVRGKRCLDVGTSDGFLAFELERRGAREVVATDLADHELWDWPRTMRARGVEYLRTVAGPDKGLGLGVAKELLGSDVEPVEVSAYDLARTTPLARFHGASDACQWWVPNPAEHRRMLESAGFAVERESRPYAIPFGEGHTPRGSGARRLAGRLARRVVVGGEGVPHHALLASPDAPNR